MEINSTILHNNSLVWDNHACMPLDINRTAQFMPELSRCRDAGTNVVSINIGYGDCPLADLFKTVAYMRHWIRAHNEEYVLASTVGDIEQAQSNDKLAVVFDIESMTPLGDQVSLIEMFYELGVRWMLITYNKNNQIGGGCHDEDEGLTELGRRFIDEMARVGMVVCCSHTGYRTVKEVCNYSSHPVILSHSNPRQLVDHERNVPNDVMTAIAATGGVMGINGIHIFLNDPEGKTETIVQHIDYAVQTIGAEHVGLGLDIVFDLEDLNDLLHSDQKVFPPGKGYATQGLSVAPEQLPEITESLLRLGYSDQDVRNILGANFLRVARQVWK